MGRLGLALLALTMSGCFEKSYTDRMDTTVRLFNHYDTLNRNLLGESNVDNFRVRVPREFEQIAAPVPVQAPEPGQQPAAEAPAESGVDERQPDYLGIQLLGMTAAWKKTVQTDATEGDGVGTAYIYLLSNQRLFSIPEGQPGRIEPLKFQEHMVNLLAGDLGVPFRQEDWRREQYPLAFDLVPKITYDALKFVPERPIADLKTNFDVFISNQGDIQALVLVVYPDLIRPTEKLDERVKLMLGTLKIPSQIPGFGAPVGGGAGGGF